MALPRSPYAPDLSALRDIARDPRAQEANVSVQPSQPDYLGSAQGTFIILPGANFAPAGSIPVDEIGDATIAPGGQATLVTVPVPDTFRLVAAGIGFHTDDDLALRYLQWSIRRGPDAAPGYPQQLAAVGSIRQLATIQVLCFSSQTLSVLATISPLAPISYRYACRLRGWFYSEKLAGIEDKGGQ